jgi:hypothetical protein
MNQDIQDFSCIRCILINHNMTYIENYVLKNASEKIKIFNPKSTGYKRDMMYFFRYKGY